MLRSISSWSILARRISCTILCSQYHHPYKIWRLQAILKIFAKNNIKNLLQTILKFFQQLVIMLEKSPHDVLLWPRLMITVSKKCHYYWQVINLLKTFTIIKPILAYPAQKTWFNTTLHYHYITLLYITQSDAGDLQIFDSNTI